MSADEDPTHRSRRTKNTFGGENAESSSAGQGSNERKQALYHCNYCNKDISGKIRIKCAVCPDFDLCVECFSVGAEVQPHNCNHSYRVMDTLSFPLICPDWSADEENLVLEGIEMYGLWDWEEVAEHVGTKSKEQCIEHYQTVYMDSPDFPLPDLSYFDGKSNIRTEGIGEDKKDAHKGKGKKPSTSANDAPSLVEMSSEYDNDAEQLLAEMEFSDSDSEDVRELKLRVLRIYSKRLDERKRRKEFILERNLMYPSVFEKELSPEERKICRKYDAFMRLHSKEEHEELLRTVISEHRTLKRIQQLKEARANGCQTSAEADRYFEEKRRREAEDNVRKTNQSAQGGPSTQVATNALLSSDSVGTVEDLLSESEKRLCREMRWPAAQYLKMQEVIAIQIFKGSVIKKSDAHRLFSMEETKIDRVYDMLVKKGIAQP